MNSCFTIMPFGGYFDGYYNKVVKAAVTECGLTSVRADAIYGTGAIIGDIYKGISSSILCIADVTDRNPNVSYELGLAHALHKPVIIITQSISDVPFDYKHLRIIRYDPRDSEWAAALKAALVNTIKEVRSDPKANMVFKPAESDEDKMRRHLTAIFFEAKCELMKIDEMFCDEQGDVSIKTQWKVKAASPIYHLCHNILADRAGKIEIKKVRDRLNARDLDVVTLERGELHMSSLFLLKNLRSPGDNFIIDSEVFVEHYMEDLVVKGSTMMANQAAQKSLIEFKDKTEIYHFPRIDKFKAVHAEILAHPRAECVGKKINCVDTGSEYILKIVYDSERTYRSATGVMLRL